MTDATLLLRHARELLTLDADLDPRDPWSPSSLGIIPDGAVAVCGDRVVAVGRTDDVERAISLRPKAIVLEVGDAVLCPGLVDPHTHALFAGDRAGEFSQRVRGDGYAEIAARGGGIASTVRAVRGSDDAALTAGLRARLDRMRAYGTTTVEVKTGYALDLAHELRCLEILGRFAEVVPTFLPLHAVPPERRGEPDGRARFLDEVLRVWLPAVLAQGAARFIDAYVDATGFSVAEAEPVLRAAFARGLRARLHVGQFADVGGAALAASLGAASADHLEHLDDDGARALAAAGVVGVLLPGAALSLGQSMPDARRLRELGMDLALGTDCNPGTSHTDALPLMATLAVRQMGMSTPEAWHAITRVAARALDLPDRGVIRVGARADLAVLDLASWEALPYAFGGPRARHVVLGGRALSLAC
jgi:imidazolonepropionase